eukprot:CAMPEP_0113701014 /NCGR_PEP_ID=MMETSP0038_2-20120614/24317_1 /TAXON_ID=2898 /ORGANISM="Cryptomonas paramecium" /LENGTH=36 /DNA_ID=CAMNT_0000624815 /DNA_START=744 /DNA_END=854 /DNA_ORIENTATION=- /assembly_acc=CAM_ASM_000170
MYFDATSSPVIITTVSATTSHARPDLNEAMATPAPT